ncbi:hypothetical protein H0H93_006176 [Arthromyces matolae]|nr:hypothetical protein H0H93_006176 [Arthromyces matolae]
MTTNQASAIALRVWYIQEEIFSGSTLRDVQALSYTCRDFITNARKHIRKRVTKPFRHYPFDAFKFLQFLQRNDSVVFGSTVASVLLPCSESQTGIDICVPLYKASIIVDRLESLLQCRASDISLNYPSSVFRSVWAIGRDLYAMKVFVAPTQNVLATVFNSPSTSHMNYMTGSQVYCAYPDLTFNKTFMFNIGTVFYDDPIFDVNDYADTIMEVERKGFVFKGDDNEHVDCGTSPHCSLTWRALGDGFAWAFVVEGYPRGNMASMKRLARNTRWSLQRGTRD